ncbi:MAG: hypothetical protein H6810_06380 [Phycisphaeraceae bacterium]|nr:MAG: hypothetical protein H6810_06380 [Phycisphaeraceae bacterium]
MVITFSGLDTDSVNQTGSLGHGITIENNGGGAGRDGWRISTGWAPYFSNIAGASGGAGLADHWGASDITYTIDGGANRFGLLLSTGVRTVWDIEVYDTEGHLLATGRAATPNVSKAVFVGYESLDTLIGSFRIRDSDNGYITLMDDVRFETVPAPGALSALGLAGLAGSRRRR